MAKSQGINIVSGGNLTAIGTATIDIDDGNLINNGTYTKGSETVTFSGNTGSIITGTSNTDMYNLIIINSGGLTTKLNLLTVNNLSIASGSKFTIDTVKAVTVNGSITNSAGTDGLVVKSEVTGTASLIHNTDNVPATVQRYISSNTEAWHFLSSPVADQPISGEWLPAGTYGNGTGYDLYLWNEANSCWIYNLDITSPVNWNTVHPGGDFAVGRGYLYSVQAVNPTKVFVGNLNNGVLNYKLSFISTNISLEGFNLVGNPYPSSIDWQAAAGWTRSDLVSSGGGYDMWIWNPTASNYGVYNSADADGTGTNSVTRYIAPMQGYFVQAAAAGNLSMDNAVRVHNGAGNWFKSTEQEVSQVGLIVKSDAGYGFDEIQLGFGYPENENGAIKLFSKVLSAPSLYMASEGDFLSVLYLNNTDENPSVPFRFTPGMNGRYTLTCNFDMNKFETVMLEDRQTTNIQDMKVVKTYGFNAMKSDDADRFVLHFGSSKNTEREELPASIYFNGTGLTVDLTQISKVTEVMIYDISGRLISQQKLQGECKHVINIDTYKQVLLIHLKNPDGSLCQKLLR